jgi:hypothetical protein
LVEAAGLRTGRQRLDSTHIVSNIKLLIRLGLFVDTMTMFLKELRKEHPRICAKVAEELLGRYLDREGYFADARSSEAKGRLSKAAVDAYWLVERFGDHRSVAAIESFGLVRRLYEEQCGAPESAAPEKVELQEKPSSLSLQSPSDPDVTYGHKGKGYEVQLTETCGEENPFEVVTSVSVNGAHESDQHQVEPAIEQVERTCGAAPEELEADSGYASGENIIKAEEQGTELVAPIGSKGPESPVTLGDFEFDETGERVLQCPAGQCPVEHRGTSGGKATVACFDPEQCEGCFLRDMCPAEPRRKHRVVRFTPEDVAVAKRRMEQETSEFKERYKLRSGIEATNLELKRCHGFGKPRVRRRPRIALSVRLKAIGMNMKRYVGHLVDVSAGKAVPVPCTC